MIQARFGAISADALCRQNVVFRYSASVGEALGDSGKDTLWLGRNGIMRWKNGEAYVQLSAVPLRNTGKRVWTWPTGSHEDTTVREFKVSGDPLQTSVLEEVPVTPLEVFTANGDIFALRVRKQKKQAPAEGQIGLAGA